MKMNSNDLMKKGKQLLPVFFFALAGVLLIFAEMFSLVTDRNTYDLSCIKLIFVTLSSNGNLISFSFFSRILSGLLIVCFLGSLIFFMQKKYIISGTLYTAVSVLTILLPLTLTSLEKKFIQAGAGTVTLSYQPTFYIFLLLNVILAIVAFSLHSEKFIESIFLVCSCISIASVAVITIYMIIMGLPAIKEIGLNKFLFGTTWTPSHSTNPQYGILSMIFGSIAMTLGAIVIGVPIGLLTAVCLAEIAPKWLSSIIRPAVELLAGIPSVIYGFFGMLMIVPLIQDIFDPSGRLGISGQSLLAAILILGIMILPTIISTAETGIRAVPNTYKEASLALGATPITTIFKVTIPAARSSILSGVILGVGRAIGETMAVIMVAGNIVQMPSLLKPVRPLTVGIVMEMSYASGLHKQALFAIGLVLFVFIMIINYTFTRISKKGVQLNEQ